MFMRLCVTLLCLVCGTPCVTSVMLLCHAVLRGLGGTCVSVSRSSRGSEMIGGVHEAWCYLSGVWRAVWPNYACDIAMRFCAGFANALLNL